MAEDYLFYQRHKESLLSGVAADKTNKNPEGFSFNLCWVPPPGINEVNP
jgi:malate synthase